MLSLSSINLILLTEEVEVKEKVVSASVSDVLLMSFIFYGLFLIGQLNCICPALPQTKHKTFLFCSSLQRIILFIIIFVVRGEVSSSSLTLFNSVKIDIHGVILFLIPSVLMSEVIFSTIFSFCQIFNHYGFSK